MNAKALNGIGGNARAKKTPPNAEIKYNLNVFKEIKSKL